MAELAGLEDDDLDLLALGDVLRQARGLHDTPPEGLPSALLRRLSTIEARLVTGIAAGTVPSAPPADCVRALRRLRFERERANLQQEIDRLQGLGALQHDDEIDALWQRKKALLHRIDELT
jgi:hypothetical protein